LNYSAVTSPVWVDPINNYNLMMIYGDFNRRSCPDIAMEINVVPNLNVNETM